MRLWTASDQGYGFIDTDTPELIMAVDKAHRGEGVGTLLLTRLIEEAGSHYRSISLSVAARNRALRLYERLGFKVMVREGDSYTMWRELP